MQEVLGLILGYSLHFSFSDKKINIGEKFSSVAKMAATDNTKEKNLRAAFFLFL